MQNYARIMRNKHGKLRYVVGVTSDVTRDVRATEMLKKRAEENRRLVDQVNIATESAGISSWELDLVNRALSGIENPIASLAHVMAGGDLQIDRLQSHVVAEDRALMPEVVAAGARRPHQSHQSRYARTPPTAASSTCRILDG